MESFNFMREIYIKLQARIAKGNMNETIFSRFEFRFFM